MSDQGMQLMATCGPSVFNQIWCCHLLHLYYTKSCTLVAYSMRRGERRRLVRYPNTQLDIMIRGNESLPLEITANKTR